MKECENCCKKLKDEDTVIVEDYSWFCSEERRDELMEGDK